MRFICFLLVPFASYLPFHFLSVSICPLLVWGLYSVLCIECTCVFVDALLCVCANCTARAFHFSDKLNDFGGIFDSTVGR